MSHSNATSPDFAKGNGMLPAIAQDAATGEVLMLAYANAEAIAKTTETGELHLWSRSRRQPFLMTSASSAIDSTKLIQIEGSSSIPNQPAMRSLNATNSRLR